MLEFIKNDHRNMKVLLNVLQEKLVALKAEQPVRYSLIRDIIEYLQSFSDKYHHPHEDIIYNYYLKHKFAKQQAINYLEAEHKAVAESTESLKTTVDMILLDSIVPLDQFIDELDGFVQQQFRHMKFEDEQILPALEEELTDSDWKAIIDALPYEGLRDGIPIEKLMNQLDPLFGREVADRYKDLYERISGTD